MMEFKCNSAIDKKSFRFLSTYKSILVYFGDFSPSLSRRFFDAGIEIAASRLRQSKYLSLSTSL